VLLQGNARHSLNGRRISIRSKFSVKRMVSNMISKLVKNRKIELCMAIGAILFVAIGLYFNAGYVTIGLASFGAILGMAFGIILFEIPKKH
jgi:cytosine/uracil/thiamine/allantoin permease